MTERSLFREPERNKLVPAEMTDSERALHKTIQDARNNMDDLRNQLKEAETLFQKYRDSCVHALFYDQAGIPYTIRFCGICDKKLETI